jgi:hypothetical protein
MDYPFYLRELCRLPTELHAECLRLLDDKEVIKHPHFTSEVKNKKAYRVREDVAAPVVKLIADHLAATVLPGVELFWNEINCLQPQGLLGEHSDLAYAGYNTDQGFPMEVMLTHKIHVHLAGTSVLKFRRSKYEPQTEFRPAAGTCYWYNNYVWHESFNPGDEDRLALSLIYHDRQWKVKSALFQRMGIKYNDCYQL